MIVYNLTDVPTKVLEAQHLVGQSIVVGKELISPGESKEVEDTPHMRTTLEHFLTMGAVAIDTMPPPYVLAKSKVGKTSNVVQPAKPVEEQTSEPMAETPSSKKKSGK